MLKKQWPILAILLLAFAWRTYHLTQLPPGLTHDEANHGREALGVLHGVYLFYFPLNYGSEPLYSYTVAGLMALIGKQVLALRLVNVFLGLLALAATYRWAKNVWGQNVATLTAVLLTFTFWPLASSREALRAGMLPFFMTTAVLFFGQFIRLAQTPSTNKRLWWSATAGFGISIAITLHIYLAARTAWLVFPAFLFYLGFTQPPVFRRLLLPTIAGLLLAGVLVTPMFLYLGRHPEAETRLVMLDRPLEELKSGNVRPLLENGRNALLAFGWPGYGDEFLAYNLPGRPVFDALTAVFLGLGIAVCLWHWRKPPYAFLLLWFGVGILPSLVTGPTANTTRNLAALPAIFILPALGFTFLSAKLPTTARNAVLLLWLPLLVFVNSRDYFVRWGESPEVRGAYQHTLVEMLTAWQQRKENTPATAVVFSTVYPGPAHDSSIGLVLAGGKPWPTHWVDGRYALLFPAGQPAYTFIPSSTPPHPFFQPFLQPLQTTSLRPSDLDPAFTFYQLDPTALDPWLASATAVNFGNAVQLEHSHWLNSVQPGQTAELLTVWRVLDPNQAGTRIPPTDTTDMALFTHVLQADGSILAQHDSLEAPSWDWQTGDVFLQIHPIPIPPETRPGTYSTAVGLYDRATLNRLPILDDQGLILSDFYQAPPLIITAP